MSKSSKSALDNRANQLNPNHPAYHQSRGNSVIEAQRMARLYQPSLDNHANQLNPNHASYAASRGKAMAATSSKRSLTKSK